MNNAGYHHPRPIMLAATLVSVALHLFLLLWFSDFQLLPSVKLTRPSPTIAINLVKDNPEVSTSVLENSHEPSDRKTEEVKVEPLLSTIKQDSMKITSPPVDSHAEPESNASGISLYGDLSQFAESFTKSYPEESENSISSSVFDSELQEQLDKRIKQQQSSQHIQQLEQFKKDNDYYEFSGAGDTRMVRIDGQCFIKQDKNPLDEFQNPIMLYAGDCSKKKPLKFTLYAPHVKQTEKRYDRR